MFPFTYFQCCRMKGTSAKKNRIVDPVVRQLLEPQIYNILVFDKWTAQQILRKFNVKILKHIDLKYKSKALKVISFLEMGHFSTNYGYRFNLILSILPFILFESSQKIKSCGGLEILCTLHHIWCGSCTRKQLFLATSYWEFQFRFGWLFTNELFNCRVIVTLW